MKAEARDLNGHDLLALSRELIDTWGGDGHSVELTHGEVDRLMRVTALGQHAHSLAQACVDVGAEGLWFAGATSLGPVSGTDRRTQCPACADGRSQTSRARRPGCAHISGPRPAGQGRARPCRRPGGRTRSGAAPARHARPATQRSRTRHASRGQALAFPGGVRPRTMLLTITVPGWSATMNAYELPATPVYADARP